MPQMKYRKKPNYSKPLSPDLARTRELQANLRVPFEEFYPVFREHGAEPKALETFWNELGDIPVDDDGIIQEPFLWWPKGTDREDIWHWFDEKYPDGVVKLMGLEDNNASEDL